MAPRLTIEDLHARGIVHPRARDEADLLAAVQLLVDTGATLEELQEYGIQRTVSSRRVRGGPWYGSDADAALAAAGIEPSFSHRLRLAMGLRAGTGLGLTPVELEATEFFNGVRAVVGEDETLAIARVIGSASARIARATTAMLRVNFATPIDSSPAALTDAVTAYTTLIDSSLPQFLAATTTMIRRHLAAFIMDTDAHLAVDETHTAATERLVVGFADLIGFTAFTEGSDAGGFMAAMIEFEATVHEVVVANGGTVVKMIGDEVMFVTRHGDDAVAIAEGLTGVCRSIAGLSGMRIGLSRGEVINAGGDYYGTVVNIASRIVGQAFPDAIVATQAVVDVLPGTLSTTALGPHELRGISRPVMLYRIHQGDQGSR